MVLCHMLLYFDDYWSMAHCEFGFHTVKVHFHLRFIRRELFNHEKMGTQTDHTKVDQIASVNTPT